MNGPGGKPAVEPTLRMRPRCRATMAGRNAWVSATSEVMLSWIISSSRDSGRSSSRSRLRATSTTPCLSAAKSLAYSAPSPDDAPVINAVPIRCLLTRSHDRSTLWDDCASGSVRFKEVAVAEICSHLEKLAAPGRDPVKPGGRGCKECLESGDEWVHLRLCMICGHVGCCDDSPNKHATST